MQTIDTVYRIIGSGAAGLAFADRLIADCDVHFTIVDGADRHLLRSSGV